MRAVLITLIVWLSAFNINAQFIKNFFKYSTIYASGRVGQPLQESNKDWYVASPKGPANI